MLKIFSHSSFSTRKKPSNKKKKGSKGRSLGFYLGVVVAIALAVGMIGIPMFGCFALVAGHITGAQFVSLIGLYTPIYGLISESILGIVEVIQVIPSIIPMI